MTFKIFDILTFDLDRLQRHWREISRAGAIAF